MKEFNEIFDFNDMTASTWKRLANRLQQEMKDEINLKKLTKNRYTKQKKENSMTFVKQENKEFSGIIDYLRKKSSGNIENEISVTSSLNQSNSNPINVTIHEDQSKYFNPNSNPNNWICFDFKNYRVIPTDYTMKSMNQSQNWCHPKSWVFEGSNDNSSWAILDEEKDCSYLNGRSQSHTFKVQHQTSKEFRYVRLFSKGNDWFGTNYFPFSSFELYGKLIEIKQ